MKIFIPIRPSIKSKSDDDVEDEIEEW